MSHVYLKLSVEDGKDTGLRGFGPLGAVKWVWARLGPSDDPWRGTAGVLRVFSRSRPGEPGSHFQRHSQWHPMCAELLRAKFITGPTSFVKFYENNHPGSW